MAQTAADEIYRRAFPWNQRNTPGHPWHDGCCIGGMHIPVERLLEFVMTDLNLTESEQAHLVRCPFCIQWLDACVEEKIVLIVNSHREQ